jgi:transposase
LGNPLRLFLTGGNVHDMVPAVALLTGLASIYLMADKGYDADSILELATTQNQIAVIPPRSNRKVQRQYDAHMYKERHLVECFFQKLKSFRRIATRYEKLAITFNSWLLIASCLLWLK